MDALVERLSRAVAQRTSRRGFLGYLGKALVGGMMIPLLPINRVVEQAQAAMGAENSAEGESGDLTSCDYWRYCGIDGNLCACCGGGSGRAAIDSSRAHSAFVKMHSPSAQGSAQRASSSRLSSRKTA